MALYVVATPIGNLEDISPRARRTLGEVGAVLAEDTRHAGRLLAHLGLSTTLVPYHDHTSPAERSRIIARLTAGEDLALVSDAGTPAISDPGYRLVREAQDRGVSVHPVPGPSAVMAFLSVCGLPTDAFRFDGFAPRRPQALQDAVKVWGERTETTIVFESPHRLVGLLQTLARELGEREVAVGRELTKMHEEVVRGPASAVAERFAARERVRGELVVGISGAPRQRVAAAGELERWAASLAPTGIRAREAANVLAQHLGVSPKDAYRALLDARRSSADIPPEANEGS